MAGSIEGPEGSALAARFAGLRAALVMDALDAHGLRRQALQCAFPIQAASKVVAGVAKTMLWMDFAHDDPDTYALELQAVDSIRRGDLIVCATANSARSAVWGELLTTAAMTRQATGLVTDGAIRDVAQMRAMGFPFFAQHLSPYDSFNRQKVAAYDVVVELGGVSISPGDIIVADVDGVVVVPGAIAADVADHASEKASKESIFRRAVHDGQSIVDAYRQHGVL